MKYVECVYWSRYDEDNSHRWFNLIGYNENKIATRGIWVSGKYSHGEYKRTPKIIRFLSSLDYDERVSIPQDCSIEELDEWFKKKAKRLWSNFAQKIEFKKNSPYRNKWKYDKNKK